MKKSLVLFSSLLVLITSCQNDSSLTQVNMDPVDQVQALSVEDKQAQSTVNDNKKEVVSISQSLFNEYFSDDTEFSATNAVVINNKGGMLFNLLNKSTFAQKIAYSISNAPVKAKFNKHGVADTIPKINQEQTEKLLSVLKTGDIILCGNDDSFVHAILYTGKGQIVHSLASKDPKFWGVVNEPLTQYLKRASRDKFVVLRYKNLKAEEVSKAVKYAQDQTGKPYDTLFLMNSETRFYCTELVYQSLMQMSNAPKVLPHKVKYGWNLITNEDFMDSPELETVWTLNKQRPAVAKLHKY